MSPLTFVLRWTIISAIAALVCWGFDVPVLFMAFVWSIAGLIVADKGNVMKGMTLGSIIIGFVVSYAIMWGSIGAMVWLLMQLSG